MTLRVPPVVVLASFLAGVASGCGGGAAATSSPASPGPRPATGSTTTATAVVDEAASATPGCGVGRMRRAAGRACVGGGPAAVRAGAPARRGRRDLRRPSTTTATALVDEGARQPRLRRRRLRGDGERLCWRARRAPARRACPARDLQRPRRRLRRPGRRGARHPSPAASAPARRRRDGLQRRRRRAPARRAWPRPETLQRHRRRLRRRGRQRVRLRFRQTRRPATPARPARPGSGDLRRRDQTCVAGHWGACTGDVAAGTETCNGVDDDCDGTIDEGLTAPLNANQLGACSGTRPALHAGGRLGGRLLGAVPGYGLAGDARRPLRRRELRRHRRRRGQRGLRQPGHRRRRRRLHHGRPLPDHRLRAGSGASERQAAPLPASRAATSDRWRWWTASRSSAATAPAGPGRSPTRSPSTGASTAGSTWRCARAP